MYFRNILFILFFALFFSCESQNEKQDEIVEVIDETIDETIECSNATTIITEDDAIAIPSDTNPVYWIGNYNSSLIQINFTKEIGFDNATERLSFVFKKINNCLELDYAYKYYDGKLVDVSAITEMEIYDFSIQDWDEDKKLSGDVTYKDPHNGQFYTRKFWLEFSSNDYIEEPTNFKLFSECYLDKLPIEIDMNNDGNIDFNLSYTEIRNYGSKPAYTEYTFHLISSNNDINFILSPKRNSSPYIVLFETPFSSEDTKQYFNGVKKALDVFYEFDAPYQKYNYFLNNNLTYRSKLKNNSEDYFVVSLTLNGNQYFGWIKFSFNTDNCSVEVLDTYLNPTPNQNINVD
ncbi:hypothetical protein [Polaribacter ponticola]|uniref:Uncharacterized protein n=1 Tax=Polaribacter ponticola TaxID=2978475 RepID=A0ABT5S4K2_9FLAO|nr:hypothetical protein [Polaribacter sp. MSW5]MDD7913040.1 hypothetical protein [Polaribacter sp. MSW5]